MRFVTASNANRESARSKGAEMTWYIVSWFLVGWVGTATIVWVVNPEEHIKLEDLAWCLGLGLAGPLFPLVLVVAACGVLKAKLAQVDWKRVVIRRKGATRKAVANKLMGVDDGST